MNTILLIDDDPAVHERFNEIFNANRGLFPDTEIRCFTHKDKFREFCLHCDSISGIFADIDLGNENGIDVIKEIIDKKKLNTVFITAYPEKTWDIFSADPCGLLIKPIVEEQVTESIKKLITLNAHGKEKIILTDKDKKQVVSANDILYIESMGKKISVQCRGSNIITYCKISDIEKDLPDYFFRAHRCYIINIKEIVSIKSASVLMSNGEEIAVSRSRISALKELFFNKFLTV